MSDTHVFCQSKKDGHKLIYFALGGLFFGFLFLTERVWAENFRDQKDRMREEFYQEQERERELNNDYIQQELRQDQYDQQLRKQEQILEMKQEKVKMDQERHEVEMKQQELKHKHLIEQRAIDERQKNMTPAEREAQKKLIEERKHQESPIDFEKEKALKKELELY